MEYKGYEAIISNIIDYKCPFCDVMMYKGLYYWATYECSKCKKNFAEQGVVAKILDYSCQNCHIGMNKSVYCWGEYKCNECKREFIEYEKGKIKETGTIVSSTLSVAALNLYPNLVFIETGTYKGGGVQVAINTGIFQEIHSIETHKPFYDMAVEHFKNEKNVCLYYGDSVDLLWGIIEPINTSITFWLDGHQCPDAKYGKERVPIMKELDIIAQHSIKKHKILIDDINLAGEIRDDWLGDGWANINVLAIQKAILKINPDYKFVYEDHPRGGSKGAILVANI